MNAHNVQEILALICAAILSTLSHVQQGLGQKNLPQRAVVLAWPEENIWQERLGQELGMEVTICPSLKEQGEIGLALGIQEAWQAQRYDGALSLALVALKKKQDLGLDFLQGEFAQNSWQFFSKRSLLAAAVVVSLVCVVAIGALWADYRALDARSQTLGQDMVLIFKQTFPKVTRIVDPYVQMQSKLREVQGAKVSIPLFTGEKRILEVLADISARVPKNISLHVFRLVIDQESVQIKGTTDAYNNVDVIKNKLAGSARYVTVKIISANADKNTGSIRFEIRLQLAETS